MARHNKKRNTGLVYEFLIRKISGAILEQNDKERDLIVSVIKRHFATGTELYREFRLFNALIETTVSSEPVVNSILNTAREAARNYDISKLEHEKSMLIKAINYDINDINFYDQRLGEGTYKIYATVQSLLNEWRSHTPDIIKQALYEDQLKQWLLSEKKKVVLENNLKLEPFDKLVEKQMFKKFNEKYKTNLTKDQADIIKMYVFAEGAGKIVEKMNSVKGKALKRINEHLTNNNKDAYIIEKMTKAKELINSLDINESVQLDDELIGRMLDVCKLSYELGQKGINNVG
jgi:hypothetical protein